jgi:tetratricopeptide (TPR) repeat protein
MKSGGEVSGRPCADEVRAALDRIVASPHFRASPQLASFLRFVVEAALSGGSDRIKGYTIAVEALGRDSDFDPQADPIVRVEAGRLRRALDRYYANGGTDDPIAIELPRGSYVPTFCHRVVRQHLLRNHAAVRKVIAAVSARARKHAAVLAFLLIGVIGAGTLAAFDVVHLYRSPPMARAPMSAIASSDQTPEARWRSMYVGPIIYVEPVAAIGAPVSPTISALSLRERLRDAFARFDEVTVLSEPPALGGSEGVAAGENAVMPADYRFASTVEYHPDGSISLTFRLLDAADGTIVWSKSYDHVAVADSPKGAKYPVVNEIAKALLQPSGVMHARERIKRSTAKALDERYRCLMDGIEYLRSFNPALHAGARDCLERMIARDPTFLTGYTALARVYLREYEFGVGVRPGDGPALDRAFALAAKAAEIKPNSARVQYVLSSIYAARGDLATARAASDRSIALNPNDAVVLFNHGSLLILTGETDKGVAIMHQIVAESPVRPPRLDFYLFLAAYLAGDVTTASYHANQITNPALSLGYLARALAALAAGDPDGARQASDQLLALQPEWRDDARGQLRKILLLPTMIDQIATDLARARAGAPADAANDASGIAKAKAQAAAPPPADAAAPPQFTGSGMPTIRVEPFATTGELSAVDTDKLRGEVADALGRFDTVEIAGDEPGAPVDYRLTATLEMHPTGLASIVYRLLDGRSDALVWTRRFDDLPPGQDAAPARRAALRELVTTLALPTGVIHSRANEKRATFEDRRYRCFLKNMEFWQRFDTDSRVRARTCLEQVTEADPNFAVGLASLSLIYLTEYRINLGAGVIDRPGLDRAVRLAFRSVELYPTSTVAQIALMEARFVRQEVEAGFAAGARAVENNPLNVDTLALYAARLLAKGDYDKGLAMMREAEESTLPRSPVIEFCLFLGAYLTGDWPTAILHANHITIETFPPGLVARAITSAATGDQARAASSIERLVAINPDWASDPRRLLANLFVSPVLVDRLARGLATAGLRDAMEDAAPGAPIAR